MVYYFIKVVLSALVIVIVSEVAKRSTLLGALVASLPLTSMLAMIWLYIDTKSVEKVSDLSYGIFLIVIPSLLFFILFPVFIKVGWDFWTSIGGSILITGGAYYGYAVLLLKLGIKI